MKENPSPPLSGPVPPRPTVVNTDQQASLNPIPSPVSESASGGFNAVDSNSSQESEVVYSIYIKNLPLNATASQLEEEFKKFGPIKPGGIQVRSHKQQGFCFGFVEFEVANAVERAIEASPITIGGRQAFVEEKRPNSSRVSNKGKFLAGRGGYRNDGVIGRGNYGATRFYGRGDYGEFGHRGGGARGGFSNRRGGFGYQKVEQSGSRGNQSGSNVNWSSANPNKDL